MEGKERTTEMKSKMRQKMISMTLAAMMALTPVGGAVFAADEVIGDKEITTETVVDNGSSSTENQPAAADSGSKSTPADTESKSSSAPADAGSQKTDSPAEKPAADTGDQKASSEAPAADNSALSAPAAAAGSKQAAADQAGDTGSEETAGAEKAVVTEKPEAPERPAVEGLSDEEANAKIDEYNAAVAEYNERAASYNEYAQAHNAEEEIKEQEQAAAVEKYEAELAEWNRRRTERAAIDAQQQEEAVRQEAALGNINRIYPKDIAEGKYNVDEEGNFVLSLEDLVASEDAKTIRTKKDEEDSGLKYKVMNFHIFLKYTSIYDLIINGSYYTDYTFDMGQTLDYNRGSITLSKAIMDDLYMLEYEYVEADANDIVTVTNQGQLFPTLYSVKDPATGSVEWRSTENTLMTGRFLTGFTGGDYWINDGLLLSNGTVVNEDGEPIDDTGLPGTVHSFTYRDQNKDYLEWAGQSNMNVYNQFVYTYFTKDSNPKPAVVNPYVPVILEMADFIEEMAHVITPVIDDVIPEEPAGTTVEPTEPEIVNEEPEVVNEEPTVVVAEPAAPVRANAARPAANTAIAANIADNATPQAEVIAEGIEAQSASIEDAKTPAAAPDNTWALINLIAMALTAIGALFAAFRRKEEEAEDAEAADTDDDNNGMGRIRAGKIAGLITAAVSIVAFFLTEDMTLRMVLTDKWTIMMIIILAVQALAAAFVKKACEADEEEEDAEELGFQA